MSDSKLEANISDKIADNTEILEDVVVDAGKARDRKAIILRHGKKVLVEASDATRRIGWEVKENGDVIMDPYSDELK